VPATRERCTKHAPSPKSECGHLNGGKWKAVTYAFPPGYRENAEEEEDEDVPGSFLASTTKVSPYEIIKICESLSIF
jgi:hypothetical protein